MPFQLNRIIRKITAHNPLVLFFDDLHWADSATCAVLDFLVCNTIRDLPILVIGTYRPEDVSVTRMNTVHCMEGISADWRRHEIVSRIDLNRFNRSEIRLLLDAVYQPNSFHSGLIEELLRLSGGSPNYLFVLLPYLEEQGFLIKRAGVWEAPSSLSLSSVPPEIKSWIQFRLTQLSESPSRTSVFAYLDHGSVQGDPFNSWLLTHQLSDNCDLVTVEQGLRIVQTTFQLIEALNKADSLISQGTDWAWSQQLIQKVVYEALPLGTRQDIHRKLAELLEAWAVDETRLDAAAVRIADHYAAAGMWKKEIHYLLLAARHAARVLAMQECRDLSSRLLQSAEKAGQRGGAERSSPSEVEIETCLLLGQAELAIGHLPAALEALTEAQRLSERQANPRWSCLAHNGLGDLFVKDNKFDCAIDHLEQALRIATDACLAAERLLVVQTLSNAYVLGDMWDKSISLLEDGIQVAKDCGDESTLSELYSLAGETRSRFGQLMETIEYGQRAVALKRKLGSRFAEGPILARLGYAYALCGMWGEAKLSLDMAGAVFSEYGDPYGKCLMLQGYAQYYLGRGQYGSALESLQTMQTLARQIHLPDGYADGLSYSYRWTGHILLLQDKYEAAMQSIEVGLALLRPGLRDLIGDLGLALLLSGRPAEAISYLSDKTSVAQRKNAGRYLPVLYQRLAEAYLELHDPSESRRWAERSVEAGQTVGLSDLPEERLVLAQALLAEGRLAEARQATALAVVVSRYWARSMGSTRATW